MRWMKEWNDPKAIQTIVRAKKKIIKIVYQKKKKNDGELDL